MLGMVLWGLMGVMVWADDVVVKPDSLQTGAMSIKDMTSEYAIKATHSHQDFFIKVMNGAYSRDVI